MSKSGSRRAMEYAEAIRKGKRQVPAPVKGAVDKWFLYREAYGFNQEEVDLRCNMAEMFFLPEGEKRKLVFMPWQCWIVSWLYAFWRKDGIRAVKEFLLLVPRKAGKTTMTSALLLSELALPSSDTHKPDILVTGETDDVCDIAYEKLMSMLYSDIEHDSEFTNEFGIKMTNKAITCESTRGKIRRLSAGAKNLEGFTPAVVYADEVSRMPSNHALATIRKGFMHNPNYLIYITSTFSDQPTSALERERLRVKNWLEDKDDLGPKIGALYETPLETHYLDERAWKIVQPAWELGPHVEEYYREEAKTAMYDPEERYSFKVRMLCIPLSGGVIWIGEEHLRALEAPQGDPPTGGDWVHYLGCDFSDTLSTTSLCLLSVNRMTKDIEARFKIYYCSGFGKEIQQQDRKYLKLLTESPVHKIYNQYAEEGHVTIIDGPAIDHSIVAQGIQEWDDEVGVDMILTDYYDAFEEVRECVKKHTGRKMKQVPKMGKNTTSSAHLLSNLIRQRKIKMDSNPVVLQHFKNVMAIYTPSGGLKLEKSEPNSPHKIDAVDSFVHAVLAYNISREDTLYGTPFNPIDNTEEAPPGKSKDSKGSWVLS